jgi:hypothetical protein
VDRGTSIARLLSGSWRPKPAPASLSADELASIGALLHGSGAAGLAWRRLSGSPLASHRVAVGLRQAYRLEVLESTVRQDWVALAFQRFRAAGVEPLVAKGWAAARLYPEDGLRRYEDVDVYVHPSDFARAQAVKLELAGEGCVIDLHRGVPQLADYGHEAVMSRSRLVALGSERVRVMGEADHLRLLALHLLGHGAWRPLWLCDVGVAMEGRSEAFDWDVVLGGTARRAEWCGATILLAARLLGASLTDVPESITRRLLPGWLSTSVLRQWGRMAPDTPQGARVPMWQFLHRPRGIVHALAMRWPNPVEATVGVGGPFNALPRWPFQIGDCIRRGLGFVGSVPGLLRERRSSA